MTVAIFANGQIVKIQGGTSISKLNWEAPSIGNSSLFDEILIGYSIFAGIDYFDKQFFNLSSNIGIIRKGGKTEIYLTDMSGSPVGTWIDKPTLDYLSLNTTIDFKYPIKDKISPFISAGPRLDYLLNSSRHFDTLDDLDDLNSVSIGLILGAGVKYSMSNLQFGLRTDYYLDFIKIADWPAENGRGTGKVSVNTFAVNLTVGYRLK